MAWNLYDTFRRRQVSGSAQSIDLASATVMCALVSAAYSVNQNTHATFNDINGAEVAGTGYTDDGEPLANITITTSTNGLVTVDSDDPDTWSADAGGFTDARRAVIYARRSAAEASASSFLIAYSDDFGADKTNVGGDFTIQIDASGIFTSPR